MLATCVIVVNVDERTDYYPPAVSTGEHTVTGELGHIAGKAGTFRMFRLEYWVGVSETTAVGFALAQGVPVAVGLVHYEPITALGLRDISVAAATNPEPWMPRWDGPEPPTPERLRGRFRVASGQTVVKVEMLGTLPGTAPEQPRLVRLPDMDTEMFYREVATFYRHFERTTGKPTSGIAQAGNVPHSTAARWVREARKRGFLAPATKRGK